jgi:hypothetical protein
MKPEDFFNMCSKTKSLNAQALDIIYDANQVTFIAILPDTSIILKQIDSKEGIPVNVRVPINNIDRCRNIISMGSFCQFYFVEDNSIKIIFRAGMYGMCTINLKGEPIEELIKEPEGL